MKIYEIGTGYTSIPAKISAATEIVVEELTKAMVEMDVDVEIIDIYDPKRLETNLAINEVKIPTLFINGDIKLGLMHKAKRVVYSIYLAKKIKEIINKSNEKIVLHFHNQYNMFFYLLLTPTKLKRRCITAYTNHSGIWRLNWDEIESTIKRKYFQEAISMKYADYVFALNKETIDNASLHLNIPNNKFIQMSNGVNTKIYKPLRIDEIDRTKEKYNLKDKKIILQVGSIYENKGQLQSIKNLKPSLLKHKDLVYCYAGGIISKEYKEKIDEYVIQNELINKVNYLGMIKPGKNLNELYNIAEFTMLSSKYEGFSLVVIESMSAGTPVLMNKNNPLNIKKGLIYVDGNECSNIVDELLKDNNISKFKAEARESAINNYDWKIVAKQYMNSWGNN